MTGRILNQTLSIVLTSCMAALIIVILWQVASRYLLADPSSFTEEAARFLLLWVGLLGSCHAFRTRSHLGLDLLTSKLDRRQSIWAGNFVLTIVILFAFLVLIVGGGRLVWLTLSLKQTSAAMGIPMGYIYSVLPLSGVLFIYYSLNFWQSPVINKPQHGAEGG